MKTQRRYYSFATNKNRRQKSPMCFLHNFVTESVQTLTHPNLIMVEKLHMVRSKVSLLSWHKKHQPSYSQNCFMSNDWIPEHNAEIKKTNIISFRPVG